MKSQEIMKPFQVSVEGNIGAGKSTLIKHFSRIPEVASFMEPVFEWCNVRGQNLLKLLYQDLNKWNFMFSNYIQLSRLKTQIQQSHKKVHIFERSLQNNRFCFLEMSHSKQQFSEAEYVILCKWYDWLQHNIDIHLDLIVYLRTSPELCYERIQQRNRPEESTVSLKYLQELHMAYESWLLESKTSLPVLVIDANKELDQMWKLYIRNKHYILGHSKFDPNKQGV